MELDRGTDEFKRVPAKKCKIADIYAGEYSNEKRLVEHPRLGEIKRVRLLGTVTRLEIPTGGPEEDEGGAEFEIGRQEIHQLYLDDGTGVIRCAKFEPFGLPLHEGDIIDVVGMIRPYRENYSVNLEIITPVTDPNFITLRELDIVRLKKKGPTTTTPSITTPSSTAPRAGSTPASSRPTSATPARSNVPTEQKKDAVLEIINADRSEDGITFQALVDQTGYGEAEMREILSDLLTESSIFEPTKAHYRAL